MNNTLVSLVAMSARSEGERVLNGGGDKIAVARAVMKDAHRHYMAPDESEAFMAAVAALWEIYPDDQVLRDETRAIGDRNKILLALTNGVPVDFERVELQQIPEGAIGLLEIWQEITGHD